MARKEQYVVGFRADEYLMERLMQFAADHDLYNMNGEPNLSSVCKLLIATGFQDYAGQNATMQMYQIARAQVLTEVKGRLNEMMAALASQV